MGFFRTCTHKAADFLHLTISKRPKGGGWYLSPPFYGDPWRCDVTVNATISRRFNMTQTRCTPVLHICEASARFIAAACTCELAPVEARNSAWSTTKIFSADAGWVSDSRVSANSSCQRAARSSASSGVGVCRRWTSNTMGLNHGSLGDKPKFGYWFQRSRQRILATLSIAEKDGDKCTPKVALGRWVSSSLHSYECSSQRPHGERHHRVDLDGTARRLTTTGKCRRESGVGHPSLSFFRLFWDTNNTK